VTTLSTAERVGRTIADVIFEMHERRVTGDVSTEDFFSMVDDISDCFGLDLNGCVVLKTLDNVNQLANDLTSGVVPVEDASSRLTQVFSSRE